MPRQYITTAIDFPNAAPHMGHVMEKILADVVARWFRLRGDETRFQIGTDDHGIKVQRTAEKLGMRPEDLVRRNAPVFQDLFLRLNVSFDFFVSTSATPGHYATVQALWKRLLENGQLEKRTYKGLYCSGCEAFVTGKDLADGKCPNHQVEPEEVTEENWFFLLSRQEGFLKKLIAPGEGTYRIVPGYRGNEVRSFLDSGLEDVSFSRQRSALYWGVPVPGDDDQVMYVWCDNLTNYISTLGYLTEREDRAWWDGAEVTHVIGKDIARFHALNWPAMLHSAGIKTPDRLLVHGFITSEKQKMSKSVGNVVIPDDVIARFGVDPLRFYLSHEIPVGRDGDFSWERMGKLYDAKLRNDIGNLLNRVLILLQKSGGALSMTGDGDGDWDWDGDIEELWKHYEAHMNAFELSEALQVATGLAARCNRFVDGRKPWDLEAAEKRQTLSQLAEALRHLSLMLLPFVPETAQRMARQLNVPYAAAMGERGFAIGNRKEWDSQKDWKTVGDPEILFAPLSS